MPQSSPSLQSPGASLAGRTEEEVHGERLTGRILLDGRRFTACRFETATLVYSGIGAVHLSGCSFTDVRFEFAGPAANALAFLQAMARPSSGLKDVVKASFPQIYGH